MREWLDVQRKLLPDMTEVLKKRYTILQHISGSAGVGRRALAASLCMTERVLRAEVDFLKEQGLIVIDATGMRISESGMALLEQLQPLIKELLGLSKLEDEIKRRYNLKQVIVVPGDSDQSLYVKQELGRAGASALRVHAQSGDVIAVTGGSTMAEVADAVTRSPRLKGCCFVPARGGLGETVELQANSIASTMAKGAGGTYRLLHVPDHLSEEAYQSLMQAAEVREILDVIRQARVVVHGIGDALVMARRRKVETQTITLLQQNGAVAEAFSYYFNDHGQPVHNVSTAGLRLDDIARTEVVLAVAGGKSKAEAISAIMRYGHEDVLVTDEAAALGILDSVDPVPE